MGMTFSFTQHLIVDTLVPGTVLNALHVLPHLFNPPTHFYKVGTILIFHILETRKLRDREVKVLTQVYTDKASGKLIPELGHAVRLLQSPYQRVLYVKNPGNLVKSLENPFTCGLKYVISFDWTNTHTLTHIHSCVLTNTQHIHIHLHTLTHTLLHSLRHTHAFSYSYTHTLIILTHSQFSNAHTHTFSHTYLHTYTNSNGLPWLQPNLSSVLPGTTPECWSEDTPAQGFLDSVRPILPCPL